MNASYSDGYAYKVPGSTDKQMMMCTVIVGEAEDLGTKSDSSIKLPHQKPGTQDRYDSIYAFTNGSYIYIGKF